MTDFEFGNICLVSHIIRIEMAVKHVVKTIDTVGVIKYLWSHLLEFAKLLNVLHFCVCRKQQDNNIANPRMGLSVRLLYIVLCGKTCE